ncbi:MAG: hypothetical protein Q9180_005335 [Flavoplaca navasiana]
MARLSEHNDERLNRIRTTAEKAKARRVSTLPADAPTGVPEISEPDEINSVEQLKEFVKRQPSLVLKMIQDLREDADQVKQMGMELEFMVSLHDTQSEANDNQSTLIDEMNGRCAELKKRNRLLVTQIAEAHVDSRESTPFPEGGRSRVEWPNAQKLKGDDDPSFTMWLQQIITKCNKDFPEESDRIDYAISRTAGRVSAYLEPFLAVGMEPLSFDELIQKLRDYLEDADPESTARQNMEGMKQKNDQKFSDFLGEWSAPAARLHMTDSEKMY